MVCYSVTCHCVTHLAHISVRWVLTFQTSPSLHLCWAPGPKVSFQCCTIAFSHTVVGQWGGAGKLNGSLLWVLCQMKMEMTLWRSLPGCHRYPERAIQRVYITHLAYRSAQVAKYCPGRHDICPKCTQQGGSFYHLMLQCPQIQDFWA